MKVAKCVVKFQRYFYEPQAETWQFKYENKQLNEEDFQIKPLKQSRIYHVKFFVKKTPQQYTKIWNFVIISKQKKANDVGEL